MPNEPSHALRVSILGAGNWGTTLAQLVALNRHAVQLWTRTDAQRDEINELHTNTAFAPGLTLVPGVRATVDLASACAEADLVIIAIPTHAFREVCRAASPSLSPRQHVIHVAKGLEVGTHARMSEILAHETRAQSFGVLSGPNLAPEVAAGKPAGTVIASHDPRVIELGRQALSSEQFMIFRSDDIVGIELAGAFKNIVAIAAGMAAQMQSGDNAHAFLVARGLAEMSRLGVAMGAHQETFSGLAGVGDLIATCASPHSRNHRVGAALARGMKLDAALAEIGMVAEGVHAARAAHELLHRHDIEAPLLERVYRVLFEGLAPVDGLHELMHLPAGRDVRRW